MRHLGTACAVALAASVLAACATSPRGPRAALSRFPIGIYAVDDPKNLARLKKDGFDSFQTYSHDNALLAALAKEAKRQGMRMVIFPDSLQKGALSATKGWPIDAWYLADEPDVVKTSSAALQSLSDKTRAWDPRRPQTFVIGQGSPAAVYGGVADILMMDWYPVPHKPADSVADQIDLVMKALPAGKPFWMVVQAYDWNDEVTDTVKRKHLRFPTQAEIRFMSYLSVLHGARGLFYFSLAKLKTTLFDYPELWRRVSGVTRELKKMQPIFEGGERVRLPFPIETEGLEARAWRYRGREYVVLVDRQASMDQLVPEEMLNGSWRALFAARRDPKKLLRPFDGGYYLRAQDVLVLENVRP